MNGLQTLLHLSLQPLLVSVLLQPPTNLSLFSQNFQHVLTWEEPNNEPLIYYDVLYSKNNGNFVPAKNCSNITIQRCDLTKHFTDIIELYTTGVQSFTHDERSNLTIFQFPLNPSMDTVVGPPIVDVTAYDSSIRLTIRPPISYLWNEKEQCNVSMLTEEVFPTMDYMIHLIPSMNAPIRLRTISEERYTTQISNLLPNTNYCVSVTITEIMNHKQVPSPVICVVTKEAEGKGDTKIYYISVFAVILAVGLPIILCALDKAGYINKKKMFTPNVLKSIPNSNYLLYGNNEFIPLGSLIFTETSRDIEVEEGHIFRAGVQENASYIANNPAIRIMEQHMRNENSLSRGELSMENSQVSNASLQLQGVSISDEGCNQAMAFLSIASFTEELPVFNTMSSINMGALKDDALSKDDTKETLCQFNRNENISIDFNTISVADPGDILTSCRKAEPSRQDPELPHVSEDPAGMLQFGHFSDVLILDDLQMSSSENEIEVEDMACKDNRDEQFTSDYIKR